MYTTDDNKVLSKFKPDIPFILSIVNLVLLIAILILLGRYSSTVRTFKSVTKPLADKLSICELGFMSFVNRKLISDMFLDDYANVILKNNYFNSSLRPDSISIKSVANYKNGCKIILKDPFTQGHGLRSLYLETTEDSSYTFNYKIKNITELYLEESEVK